MMRALLVVVLVLLVVAGALLGYYNAQPVQFDYLGGSVTWPLSALLLSAAALGVVVALAVAFLRILGLRLALRRTARQLQAVETELRNLRNLPLPASAPAPRDARGPG